MGDRLSETERKIWRQWFEVAHRATSRFDDLLQDEHGLSLVDFEILHLLLESPGGRRRMNEIAEEVLVSRSRLTYRVDRLCDRGLLTREGDAADRRGTNACLTGAGREVLAAAIPDHAGAVRSTLLDNVRDEEWPVVADLLDRLSLSMRR